MIHLIGGLPVVGHSGVLLLRRGELFVDRAEFLPQLVYRRRGRAGFAGSLYLAKKRWQMTHAIRAR